MIADLNSKYFAGVEDVDFRFEMARSLSNLSKRPHDPAGWIEDRGPITFLRQRPLPCREQRVFRFHRLQETACTDTFRLLFEDESGHSSRVL